MGPPSPRPRWRWWLFCAALWASWHLPRVMQPALSAVFSWCVLPEWLGYDATTWASESNGAVDDLPF